MYLGNLPFLFWMRDKSDHTAVSQRYRSLESYSSYEQKIFLAFSPCLNIYTIWIAYFLLVLGNYIEILSCFISLYGQIYHAKTESFLFHLWFFFPLECRYKLPAPPAPLKQRLMQLQKEGKVGGFNLPNLSVSLCQTSFLGKLTGALRWFSLAAPILKIRNK